MRWWPALNLARRSHAGQNNTAKQMTCNCHRLIRSVSHQEEKAGAAANASWLAQLSSGTMSQFLPKSAHCLAARCPGVGPRHRRAPDRDLRGHSRWVRVGVRAGVRDGASMPRALTPLGQRAEDKIRYSQRKLGIRSLTAAQDHHRKHQRKHQREFSANPARRLHKCQPKPPASRALGPTWSVSSIKIAWIESTNSYIEIPSDLLIFRRKI